MLDLIAPRAQSAWPQSRRLAGALPTGTGPGDVTASVVPGNLRVQAAPQGHVGRGRRTDADRIRRLQTGRSRL